MPEEATRVLVETFRVDANHSNSYAAWQKIGSPQQPASEQYQQLEAAGQLQLDGSPSLERM